MMAAMRFSRFALTTMAAALAGVAFNASPSSPSDDVVIADSGEQKPLGHFTWGADAGSAVDLMSDGMTNIDITGYFGYKGSWLRFAGVGVGACSMLNNSSRSFPVYGMVRTSFSRDPKLCFLDLRAGIAVNSIMSQESQTDFYGSIGIGFTLARSRKFSSHLILSYNFMPLRTGRQLVAVPVEGPDGETGDFNLEMQSVPQNDMHFAAIRIGCSF